MSDNIFPVADKDLPISDNINLQNTVLIFEKLYEIYQTKQFVDIDLIVGPDTFRIQAHRVILSCSSPYFNDEFTLKPQKSYLEVPEVDEVVMQWILRFMYTSSIVLEPQTIKGIFKAAVLFKMTILTDICLTYMQENMNSDNCLGFAQLAWDNNNRGLLIELLTFIHTHFEEVLKKDEFYELSPELLREILESDFLQVSSEDVILQNLIDWANFDPTNRHKMVVNLLSVVRYEMLDLLFITRFRETILGIPNCEDVIFSWLTYHIENREHGLLSRIRARNMSHCYSILCGVSTENLNIMTYNGMFDTWSREVLPSLERKRTYFKAVKYDDNQVIISGGKMNGYATASVDCFDPQTKKWTAWPPMGKPRMGHLMALIKNNLYVIGGFSDQSSPLMSVERYNSYTRSWDSIGVMPSPIEYSHRYAIINDRLYITDVYRPKKLRCFDSLMYQWTWHDFDHDVNRILDMVSIVDDLYFCLIESGKKVLIRFSPTEKEWRTIQSEGINRFASPRMFAFGHKLIFFGEASDGSKRILMERFDLNNGHFTSLTPLEEELIVLNFR